MTSVAEGRWWEAWLRWLRRAKRERFVNFSCFLQVECFFMTRKVTLTYHEMGQENCSQVACLIFDGRRGEWVRRWYGTWYFGGTTGMARGDDGGGAAGRFPRSSSSRRADEGCPGPPQAFPNLSSRPAKETVAVSAQPSSSAAVLLPPSSSEEMLDVNVVPVLGHLDRSAPGGFSLSGFASGYDGGTVRSGTGRGVDGCSLVGRSPGIFYVTRSRRGVQFSASCQQLCKLVWHWSFFSCLVPRRRFLHTLSRSGGTMTVSRD